MNNNMDSSKKKTKLNAFSLMVIIESGLVLVLIIFFVLNKMSVFDHVPDCFFRTFLGMVCPFCGGTRCVSNLFKFEMIKSFRYHPTTFVYLFFLLTFNFIYVVRTICNKNNKCLLKVLEISFYIYVALTMVQYFIRLYLIINHIDNSFMIIDLF